MKMKITIEATLQEITSVENMGDGGAMVTLDNDKTYRAPKAWVERNKHELGVGKYLLTLPEHRDLVVSRAYARYVLTNLAGL